MWHRPVSKEWESQNVFDVLGCEIAREILALGSLRPMSAAELADRCDVSEPTVYRRLDALETYDMVDEETEIDADGHHYKRFETNLEEVRVQVEDGSFDVDLQIQKDYTDRFVDLWEDMEKGTEDLSSETRGSTRDESSPDVSGS